MSIKVFSRRGRIVATLVFALLGNPGFAVGQAAISPAAAGEMRSRLFADLDEVHRKIIALAEVIPEGKYAWSPTPETRTVVPPWSRKSGS